MSMHEEPDARDAARAAPEGPKVASPSPEHPVGTEAPDMALAPEGAATDEATTTAQAADASTPEAEGPAEIDADTVSGEDAAADADEIAEEETIGATGWTLDQLSAYHDRGRTPRVARVEDDAEASALLDSMDRLGRLARSMSEEDERAAGDADEQWLEGLLGVIRSEVRAGRDLPIEDPDERTSTTITEGALREIARTAGDAVDGALVGRVQLTEQPEALDVRLTIGVRYGANVRTVADAVRVGVHEALVTHAPMTVGAIDVVVDDVLLGGGGR
ncbi:Asp23/Gls24 family envelope stress response protein [Agrococcus sp. SGAir0287]|uniref:Asp23/Gls24 family envelope stress response protein n=1 Tax=Agrococcus sp. SGAir0287 TaxID=2070347 RepID=UPI0010F732C6|nr:Asp23/Gls24 family envelope stress response protein [Agrococcus sp. SGAir0287]